MAGTAKKRERKERTAALLAMPMTLHDLIICVTSGGTLTEFCKARDVPYNAVSAWIASNDKRDEAYRAAMAKRDEQNKDVIIGQLREMASADIALAFDPKTNTLLPIHDIPENVRRMIAAIEIEEIFAGRGENREVVGHLKKIKLWDRNKAVETFARHHKMLTDKVEASADQTLADLLAQSKQPSA